MPHLESFVAQELLRRLVRDYPGDHVPADVTFEGAVLVADISGYTPLAEALCKQGPDGVERLGRTLELAFQDYVESVYATHGEIASFAGDALIAYWPADDWPLPEAVRHAAECARLLHASSTRVSTALGPPPRLHIGIGAGQIWAALLGGVDRSQLLLAGTAVRSACAELGAAPSGQTRMTGHATRLLVDAGAGHTGASRADAGPEAAPSGAMAGIAGLPEPIEELLHHGFSSWIPERREICSVLARIDGLDEATPDALGLYQVVTTSLQAAIRPFTASKGTLLVDDKGLVFALCLGLPNDFHEDDPQRAVRCALAIQFELARLGVDCAVGIDVGKGVCLALGAAQRRHYVPVGRFMYLAARLMEAAGNRVLCTQEVADRVKGVVGLSPERPLRLKGLDRPLPVFRVSQAAELSRGDVTLVGRDPEQARLADDFAAFQTGRGRVLLLTGEAGLGKTALVQHICQTAAGRSVRCLSGGAGSVEISAAYAAWRPVFAELLDVAGRSQSQGEAAWIVRLKHPALAPLVNTVAPGQVPETTYIGSLSGQARVDATVSVLSELIGVLSGGRFVLVLEDCHWMDSASWRLLLRVAQDFPQAFIVLTSRPPADARELDALRALDRFAEMALAPLAGDAIALIVEKLLDGWQADRALIDEVTHRAMGNPLCAQEFALLLATRPRNRPLTAVDDVVAPGHAAKALPATMTGLIGNRLDGLSAAAQIALKSASTIGDRFDLGLLVRMGVPNLEVGRLETAIDELVDKQLVQRTGTSGDGFGFQHALIREVAYERLTREQRRDLHRRVAEAIERDPAGTDVMSRIHALAHHWSRAEAEEPAVRYADRAATLALAAGAFEEADKLMVRCLDLTTRFGLPVALPERIRWYRQMADARQGLGHLESRTAAAHHVLRLAGISRPHTIPGIVGRVAACLCRLSVARVRVRRGDDVDRWRRLEVARAYRHSAEVCYFNNDMLGMFCDSLNAVTWALPLGPSAVLAGALTEMGGILTVAGMRRTGEGILRRTIAMAETAGDPAAQAYAHMISCLYYVGICDWRSAETSARRCQLLCEPMDDRVNWTNAQAVLFWMHHYRSHDRAAYDAACNLRDRATETGNRQHRAWALRFLALCAMDRTEPKDAAPLLEAALECLGETAALNERIPTIGLLALARLRSGEVWAARAKAREALEHMRRIGRPIGHSTLEGYSALLTVSLDAWDDVRSADEGQAAEWQAATQKYLAILKRYSRAFPVGEPRYLLHLGDCRHREGRPDAARRSYERGRAVALRQGMPAEVARCEMALAAIPSKLT